LLPTDTVKSGKLGRLNGTTGIGSHSASTSTSSGSRSGRNSAEERHVQAPAPKDEAVYTMAEAARLKGVSYHTASRAVRTGKLASTRLGRQALIREGDLAAWEPMVERRPKKYTARTPDLAVRPVAILPADAGNLVAARSFERLLPLLAGLGRSPLAADTLPDILAVLAATLHCKDAAVIGWIPGGDAFEVRATTGAERDWLSFQEAGPQVITRPIRLSGRTLGLFAGLPDPDRPALTSEDRDAAVAMLTLAAIAMVHSSRG
jgi:excisionase family DNA binding protein